MDSNGLSLTLTQTNPVTIDATLTCAPGQITAIVGPSGSGKSTLLRGIAGLGRSLSGCVQCNGEIWQNSEQGLQLPANQRRVGMVFQNYALFPHLTALENVIEGACRLPAEKRDAAAREWLKQVHMDGMGQRYPARLSGGQQQRVALARALVGQPGLLLLDEPFSAVDRVTREKLYRELATLRQGLNIPTLLVTHDVDEAMMLADSLCVFAQGRVQQIGAPVDVLARPASGLVARLVGHKNIFRAQVMKHYKQSNTTEIEWRGIRLTAPLNMQYEAGAQISWVVPRSKLLLYTPDPSRPTRENAVVGIVKEQVTLGDFVQITVAVGDPALPPLHLRLPLHVIERRQIRPGEEISITIEAEGIWLCPSDKDFERTRI